MTTQADVDRAIANMLAEGRTPAVVVGRPRDRQDLTRFAEAHGLPVEIRIGWEGPLVLDRVQVAALGMRLGK